MMTFIIVLCSILCNPITSPIHAQTSSALNKEATGVSLGSVLKPSHSPVHKGVPTNITITFLTLGVGQKGGSVLQPDVTILKDGKKEFQISAFAGQPGQP